jgi:hypothetical protein
LWAGLGGGGGEIEKILPTDRAIPTLFKQIQRNCFFDPDIGFFAISSVNVFFPTYVIKKEDRGDEHNFCTPLKEKTVGRIGILNSDLFSDQYFFQCSVIVRGLGEDDSWKKQISRDTVPLKGSSAGLWTFHNHTTIVTIHPAILRHPHRY